MAMAVSIAKAYHDWINDDSLSKVYIEKMKEKVETLQRILIVLFSMLAESDKLFNTLFLTCAKPARCINEFNRQVLHS